MSEPTTPEPLTAAQFWQGRCRDCAHPTHEMTCHEMVPNGDPSNGPAYCSCVASIELMEQEIVQLRATLDRYDRAAVRAEAGALDDSDRAAEAALLAGWFHRGEEICEHDMEPWSCVISAELLVKDFDVRAREGVHHSLPRGWYKAMWGAEASRGLDDSLVRHLTQWLMQSGYQRDYEHARAEAEGFDNWHRARLAEADR